VVILYSAVHLGYSLWRYGPWDRDANTFVYGADVRRPWMEARIWKETGFLDFNDTIYPPLYYALLLPLTNLEFRVVEPILYYSQFLFYLLAIWLMVKIAYLHQKPPPMAYGLATVLTVNFHPFLETLALYKVEGLEFFLICAALYAFMRKRDVLTGFLVVTAASFKYLPGILMLYFLVKREWRVVWGMLAACVVQVLVLLPIFGTDTLWRYVPYTWDVLFGSITPGAKAAVSLEFQTLTGTINRWFAGLEGMRENLTFQRWAPVPNAEMAYRIIGMLKMALVGGYLYLIRRRWRVEERHAQWPAYLCEISLTLIMIFVVIPSTLLHYAILLLPAFVVIGLLLYQQPALFRLKEKVLFAVGYSLTAVVIPGGVWNWFFPPHPLWGQRHTWVYFWFSFPFYGYLLLGLCVLLCSKRLRASPADNVRQHVTGQHAIPSAA